MSVSTLHIYNIILDGANILHIYSGEVVTCEEVNVKFIKFNIWG